MAVQFHVAHSGSVKRSGVIAGGPRGPAAIERMPNAWCRSRRSTPSRSAGSAPVQSGMTSKAMLMRFCAERNGIVRW